MKFNVQLIKPMMLIVYKTYKQGFIATTAVVLLAVGVISLSLSTMSTAIFYHDAITKKELRIQTRMNAEACLDTVTLMIIKDYFLNGEVEISRFGCKANIINDFNGNITLNIKAELGGVGVLAKSILYVGDNEVEIISREVY
ncbi:MAG: hypothetical protein WC666_04025 [Candidatus Paceibacterota bacterium]|jgi:hypothetical protein